MGPANSAKPPSAWSVPLTGAVFLAVLGSFLRGQGQWTVMSPLPPVLDVRTAAVDAAPAVSASNAIANG